MGICGSVEQCEFPIEDIPKTISSTPQKILSDIFKIQGIPLDPNDIDPAMTKIINAIGNMEADGIKTFHVFISYRVSAEKFLANQIFLHLKAEGYKPFLDQKCLKDGMDWKTGFLKGLSSSKIFVPLISSAALAPCKDENKVTSL